MPHFDQKIADEDKKMTKVKKLQWDELKLGSANVLSAQTPIGHFEIHYSNPGHYAKDWISAKFFPPLSIDEFEDILEEEELDVIIALSFLRASSEIAFYGEIEKHDFMSMCEQVFDTVSLNLSTPAGNA